ncbi:MAG: GNAT family N-acetyltransferase [Alistipes sp.]|nr:GNAT family N-acetyltransferase [Alistipes sp.]
MFTLSADRCSLRALEPSDLELLYFWENDPEVWRVTSCGSPVSRERIAQFIVEQNYDIFASKQMRLVVEVDGMAVGTVDIIDFDPLNLRFGVGVLIYDASHRRCGYAHSAIEAIKRYGVDTLGVKQIWANVAADNDASIALFESCGFVRCGHRRDWIRRGIKFVDEYEYQYIGW